MNVIIIGAGPASLMAATKAVQKGHNVTIYEKMKTSGRKFLVAGDGGFNLSHEGELDEFVSFYSHPQMINIISQFTNTDLVNWLKEIGVETYVGSSGKIFPIKEIKPAKVLKNWIDYLLSKGVQFIYNASLVDFDITIAHIKMQEKIEIVSFDKMILGLGAASWPKTGSDAKWTSLFKSKNIDFVPFIPTNAGINCDLNPDFLHKFQGAIFKNVAVSHNNTSRMGEVVLTEYGFEGAPIYYLNPSIRKQIELPLFIDFKPSFSFKDLENHFSLSKNVSVFLKNLKLPQALISWFRDNLSREEFTNQRILIDLIKRFPVNVTSFRPIDEAISCAGGVSWNEINPDLSLKKFPAVYVVGEMVDWEAPTGGYLLQGAFSMGYVVGKSI